MDAEHYCKSMMEQLGANKEAESLDPGKPIPEVINPEDLADEDLGEPEIPEAIQREEEKVQEAWRWANELCEKPFPRLSQWFLANNIDLVPIREESRNRLYQRMKGRNQWEHWQTIRARISAEWVTWPECKKKVRGRPVFASRLRNEILWRLSEMMMMNVSSEFQVNRDRLEAVPEGLSEEGMEFLPPWMRWVALHPLLYCTEEDEEKDVLLVERGKEYLKSCPNQAAKNWYLSIRGDRKAILEFFKQVGAKWSEEVKRTDKRPDNEEDPEEVEALGHVLSLEEMLRTG